MQGKYLSSPAPLTKRFKRSADLFRMLSENALTY